MHLAEHGSVEGPQGGRVWKSDPKFTIDLPSPFGYEQLLAQQRGVRCPVLVLTGDQPDAWTDVTDDELAKRVANFPDGRHVLVPGTGHYVHIEDSDATMRAIETFLADVGP